MEIIKSLIKSCDCGSECNANRFKRKFRNWTSGDKYIDKFIQDIQLSYHLSYNNVYQALEWIPYNRLYDIEFIANEGSDTIYRAKWIDGCIDSWDNKHQNWRRKNQNMFVILISINNLTTLEFINEVKKRYKLFHGITQNSETKRYMVVLDNICEKCNNVCIASIFKLNFKNWASGDDHIDKFIRDAQLSTHDDYEVFKKALEWIPYKRFYDIEYIRKDEIDNIYIAKWLDGYIDKWDVEHRNWERKDQNIFVILKSLGNPSNITSEFINKVVINRKTYGITQDIETKNYMAVLNNLCEECENICSALHFQRNFRNWTSGNNHIDKFIQDAQLSTHDNYEVFEKALEWIPYKRFYDIEHITKYGINKTCRAKWLDGYINKWDNKHQNWERKDQNIFVILKILDNPVDTTPEYINKVIAKHKIYGITQNLETKNYMAVLNDICEECGNVCSAIHFWQDFKNWTSGNDYIDKFIQDTQLSIHNDYEVFKKALEWIPYKRFYNIEHIAKDGIDKVVYKARWFDGCINKWDDKQQNWQKKDQNMFVYFKCLDNPADITLKFINKVVANHKIYGITQDLETKKYMVVLDGTCEECGNVCSAIHFQQNFKNWTSGNDYIDKFIQDAQLSTHDDYEVFKNALEWIPYKRFYDIEYITKDGIEKVCRAKWFDGCINKWDDKHQNWERKEQNMFVILKILDNPGDITSEFMNKIITIPHKVYGVTQNPETRNYMIVWNKICGECNYIVCNTSRFELNFINWTSGNNDIDKFIQDVQLLAHSNYEVFKKALEWIPYSKFYDIEYIARGGFGEVYRARWIDGYIDQWNNKQQNWKRKGQNMFVALKSLNNSKNVTLEFMNEITQHYKLNLNKRIIKLYGITQNPKTENYIMVLEYAENGSLRNYLDKCYDKLSWSDKINYLHSVAHGLKDIHENDLIHRDLHIVPQLIVELIKRCLDANSLNRPKAVEIKNLLSQWLRELNKLQDVSEVDKYTEIQKQVKEANIANNENITIYTLSTDLRITYKTHSEAVYTSRSLDFYNLPEPKNTDDYYKENDNIISKVSSECLLIDINQLKINNNGNPLKQQYSDNYCNENVNIISMNSSESLQINISQSNISKDDQNSNSKVKDKTWNKDKKKLEFKTSIAFFP
ncbi:kinase-like domain-containing protein [Rhizophagus clarus]|uniref:Kinase-like domain-containing protein n=1 Tax=Rhizophagus clarus TaxID=94130 RepID=A0A8H3QFL7_9GLOM|nr:kinase-like domain-containing protein [Rhizophagus clarus]